MSGHTAFGITKLHDDDNSLGGRQFAERPFAPHRRGVGRVLRLTLLAPDIVEAILSGRQAAGLQLDRLLRRFPVGWREQAEMLTYSFIR